MRRYKFTVSGASPGQGTIIVMDDRRNHAWQLAEQELKRMNAEREQRDEPPLTLDDTVNSTYVDLPGVVYSHSGEA